MEAGKARAKIGVWRIPGSCLDLGGKVGLGFLERVRSFGLPKNLREAEQVDQILFIPQVGELHEAEGVGGLFCCFDRYYLMTCLLLDSLAAEPK